MRLHVPYAVLLFVPFLSGCVVTGEPILKDNQISPTDKTLLGLWLTVDGNGLLDVQQPKNDGAYTVVAPENDGKPSILRIRVGKVGDLMLAEIRANEGMPDASPEANDVLDHSYVPLVVRETKPRFVIATISYDWLKEYLELHPNELHARREGDGLIIVTSSTLDIQAFLLRHEKDEGALRTIMKFVRPGDPTTQANAPAP